MLRLLVSVLVFTPLVSCLSDDDTEPRDSSCIRGTFRGTGIGCDNSTVGPIGDFSLRFFSDYTGVFEDPGCALADCGGAFYTTGYFSWKLTNNEIGFTLSLNFKRGTRCRKQLLPLQLLELDAKFSNMDVTCEGNELTLVFRDIHGTRGLFLTKEE